MLYRPDSFPESLNGGHLILRSLNETRPLCLCKNYRSAG